MGYVHDTHMSQYIPPNAFHFVGGGTITDAAGQVTDTTCKHMAAIGGGGGTQTVNIPIMIPSNSSALKGSYLKSFEVDYEVLIAACNSVTAVLHKIVRGADGAVAVESEPAITQDLTAATDAADVDQHKLTVTLTTPAWIDNDEYYLLEMQMAAAATTTIDYLGAVVNYTVRM
jgi:hypothetical protein